MNTEGKKKNPKKATSKGRKKDLLKTWDFANDIQTPKKRFLTQIIRNKDRTQSWAPHAVRMGYTLKVLQK